MAYCLFFTDVESIPHIVALRNELQQKSEQTQVHDECNKWTVDDPHEGERGEMEAEQLHDEEPEAES
jgi:hypothetical protein